MTQSGSPVQTGDLLAGKYRVESVLGSGGMGIVVAARHEQLGQRVAIKFVRDEALANKEAIARFVFEARAVVGLKSEHVAKVIDVGTLTSGAPYMVMELLEGMDLGTILEERGPFPILDAVEHIVQACEALAEAHAAGIVHRDIKPHNLFLAKAVGGAKKIKVLDFGVSKALSISSSGVGGLTSTRTMIGSPLYMSPEQMRSSRDVDARSDVWSLGVVLFELLSKATPFEADSMPELCLKVVSEPPRRLVTLRPELPPDLAAVVERCLEKDPARRFANAAELATALEPFTPPTSHVVIERARMAMGSMPSIETTGRRPSQGRVDSDSATVVSQEVIAAAPAAGHKGRWVVIAAGATALAALGGFTSIRSHRERDPGTATVAPVEAPVPSPATSLVPAALPEARGVASTIPSTAPSTTSAAIPGREAAATSRSVVSHPVAPSGQSPPRVQKPSKPVHDDDIPALR